MSKSFTAEIDAWVMQTQRRMVAVFQTAAQFVIEDMSDRTQIDTGFLKASIVVSLSGPAPMSRPLPKGSTKNQYQQDQEYTLALAGAQIGDTIWATYTANYAAHREYGTRGQAGDGMVRLAAQNWGNHVVKATAMAKAKSRG